MKKKKIIIFIVLGIIIVVANMFIFVGRHKLEEKSIMKTYSFLNAEKADVIQTVNIDGIVVSTQEVDLRFQASGVIEDVNYKVGDKILKDDILASLNANDQEIAVKQREASLSQANANLNLKVVGSSDEDVAIYQSRVDSAERILETTINSANEDVKNSEAKVSSAQVALNVAITGLETTEKQNDIDLSIAYQNAYTSIDAAILTIDKALDYANNILEEDVDLDKVYSVENISYNLEAENKYFEVNSFLISLSDHNSETNKTDHDGIDSLLSETREGLDMTKEMLEAVFNGLVASITSSSVTQADIDSYKTGINSLRTETNAARSSAENNEQNILLTKTSSDTKIITATALISTTQATLDLENSSLRSVILKLASQKTQAENSLNLANDELALKVSNPRDVDVAYLRAKVYEASASLDLARENLNKTQLISPVDGVIVAIDFEVGESISSSMVFIKLTANEKKIEADIPEIEISKVSVGDEVEIFLDAFVDEVFNGTIVSIDPVETIVQGVVYYKTDIAFNKLDSSEIVFSGMTADINILTDSRKDVLTLPGSSVKKDNSSFYVQVFEDGKIEFKDIRVGLVGDEKVEILDGLNEIETIVSFILNTSSQ